MTVARARPCCREQDKLRLSSGLDHEDIRFAGVRCGDGEGKTKKEIIRCLKRYIAREVHATLRQDLGSLPSTP